MAKDEAKFERECDALVSWLPMRRGSNLKLNNSGIDVVIEALKKQVPKKVTHEAALLKCCTCPSCKNVVDHFEMWGDSKVRVTYHYCHFCGQRLDWDGWQDEINRLIEKRGLRHMIRGENDDEREDQECSK